MSPRDRKEFNKFSLYHRILIRTLLFLVTRLQASFIKEGQYGVSFCVFRPKKPMKKKVIIPKGWSVVDGKKDK